MSFFKGLRSKHISNTIVLKAPVPAIWAEITNVNVAGSDFPLMLRLMGVPKPLSAKVIREGVGGYREATFSNGAEFHQNILKWELHKSYRFQFNATANFKVAYFMNLSKGPFEILTGGYDLREHKNGIELELMSTYQVHGFVGKLMHLPYRWVVYYFQQYLLKGIRQNLMQA